MASARAIRTSDPVPAFDEEQLVALGVAHLARTARRWLARLPEPSTRPAPGPSEVGFEAVRLAGLV